MTLSQNLRGGWEARLDDPHLQPQQGTRRKSAGSTELVVNLSLDESTERGMQSFGLLQAGVG